MRNVFCDICGSAYPESESNCPICGSSREFSLDTIDEALLTEDLLDIQPEPGASRKKPREIFDYDEVNPEEDSDDEPEFEDEEEYEEAPRSNMGLVVILLILIVLLLAAAGYIYLRFFLPNMPQKEETIPTTVATEPATEQTEPLVVETGIPCTDIVMVDGKYELGKDGKGLLNVKVFPEDTTDAVIYTSSDEAVVTVSESGTLTAVGEGQATITISCGTRQIKCSVVVDYSIEPEVTEDGELPGMEVEPAEETDPTEETTDGEETDTTEATEETKSEVETEEPQTLKLKKSDITIFSNHTSIRLEFEGNVDPAEMTWFTMDSTVAIVHDGVVTSTGAGITRVYGEYNGQQVECVIRCSF